VGVPRLTDGRVVVRVLEPKDVGPYLAAFDEGEPLLNLVGYDEVPTREQVERWLGENWVDPPELRQWEFVVADATSDAFVGTIMLHSFDWKHKRAELGSWIAAPARDRGVGSAALDLLLRWAFDDLGLERIEMTALPENDNVPHIAEKFGFTYEGRLRKRNYERGRRVDLLVWGLLKDESGGRPGPRGRTEAPDGSSGR
jgi:RimJ/RimL family protein N-acetyltransferase